MYTLLKNEYVFGDKLNKVQNVAVSDTTEAK